MGSDPAAAYPPDPDEQPRRLVEVEAFRIGRLPITSAQFHGDGDDRAVTYVSRAEAEAFCERVGVRLPTETEWEAAARGTDDRLWPWGDDPPDVTRATFAQGIGAPSPGGLHPAGASACGALDMAGNVWEWTAGDAVRGGSYLSGPNDLRCSMRLPFHPAARDPYVGFRVVAVAPAIELDWVDVPAGTYPIGRDPVQHAGPARPDEIPQRVVGLAAFELSRTPVTNAQYRAFVAATGAAAPPHWPAPDDHPVTFVDWFDATAFAVWAGGRLPSESEWEKGARGTDGRVFPWGDERDLARAAVGAGLKGGSTEPVGSRPGGSSPYGLLEMAGNVWEWVETEYSRGERVLRGGSFASPGLDWARCAMRSHSRPHRVQAHIGFRIARGGFDGG